MKMPIKPGDVITLFVKDRRNAPSVDPWPYCVVVQTVECGAISVPNPASKNGLAAIICHQASHTDGTYWYEYANVDGVATSYDVVRLLDRNGAPVSCKYFLEETVL